MECISGVGKKKCLNYIYEERKGKEKKMQTHQRNQSAKFLSSKKKLKKGKKNLKKIV